MQTYIQGLTYNNGKQPTLLYSVYANVVYYYKGIVYFSLNEYVERHGFNFVFRLRIITKIAH